jgi:hypothetical protein
LSQPSADVASQRATAAELLRTMFVDLDGSQARGQQLLTDSDDLVVQSYARQVIGIAYREHGDVPGALRELRTAMRLAERAGDVARRADVQATLGGTLCVAGRTRDGISQMNEAIAVLSGVDRAAALTRRGWVYISMQGRFIEGSTDMSEAVEEFAAAGNGVWRARALNLLGYSRLYLGDLDAADRHFEQAAHLNSTLGERLAQAANVQNRSYVAYLRGDLPGTFAALNDAAALFDAAGKRTVDLVIDQCTAYLAAGLLPEASATVQAALVKDTWVAREEAELLNARAQVALAAGDLELAENSGREAARVLEEQGREWFAVRAELVALTARHALSNEASPELRREALTLVDKSRRLRLPEHVQVLLLAANIVTADDDTADQLLREAERARRHDAALTRALGWLATARRRSATGKTTSTLEACENGLAAIDEHQTLLGSSELRALASARGQDLASLALVTAFSAGEPELILHWTERWRGTAIIAPAVAHRDENTVRDLAALRAQTQQANTARDAGKPTGHFERHIADLEHRVRERHLLRAGTRTKAEERAGHSAAARFGVPEVLDALDQHDTTLVELVQLGGNLHAITAHRGQVRLHDVGPLGTALQAQEYARFVLRRAGLGRPVGVAGAGTRLQMALLGGLVVPGDGPVIVSAPNQLQQVPWTLFPQLADRPVSTAPSAHTWVRAARQSPIGNGRAFIVGPGLASAGAEVDVIRPHDPDATYLIGAHATVDASLRAMDGASLVHIAAHGNFRQDNPLFSAIDLADGPLMVHDLEHLARPPHRVVLSACETGDMQPVGVDELLGLSISLLAMGTAGVISSLVKVHDHATADVMVHVHESLRRGDTSAQAMLAARQSSIDDPLLFATATSFTAFGV